MTYQDYRHLTKFGEFSSGTDYRKALIAQDYNDLGWKNGWGSKEYRAWDEVVEDLTTDIETHQWNNRGSDVTYTCHERKLFCSVDMGD